MRYRQIHLDFHTSERIPGIGSRFDPDVFGRTFAKANVDSVTVFAKCHHGVSYHPTKVGKQHPHLSFDLTRAQLDALHKHGIKSAIERDHAMNTSDAEVIIAGGCLLHDLGMSIHRVDHEAYSLFLAADSLDRLLEGVYEEPERTIIASEILHAIIGHRSAGRPLTLEAGIVRVADALDMEHGRSRTSLETHLANIHSLSAAAIDEVRLVEGETRPIRIEIEMNNSAGVFQVDSLLGSKLRGSGLEEHIEVVASIEAEHEKRLMRVYRV